ncbi:MAG TPA: SH3 domain-containing protein [Methylomirabilota bacterium]|jgi:SH3 domain-containing protein|nr:SH3 domain-containing protein [Methylomirabilota bacterium]
MTPALRLIRAAMLSVLASVLLAGAAAAAPGDLFKVSGERVNLRSGPSDGTTVRSTVERGDELIELRRERGWLGVRVVRTGEEGWVFQDLVQRVARTQLGAPAVDAGFQELSPPFNQLISGLGEELGYSVIDKVEMTGGDALRIAPSNNFLINAGRDAHMALAMAVYQLWKNHQNQRPVRLDFAGLDGAPYIAIEDLESGPIWSIEPVIRAQTAAQ